MAHAVGRRWTLQRRDTTVVRSVAKVSLYTGQGMARHSYTGFEGPEPIHVARKSNRATNISTPTD
jgi:hypothetical protein